MGQDITQGHIKEIYKEDSSVDNSNPNSSGSSEGSGGISDEVIGDLLNSGTDRSEDSISEEPTREEVAFLHEQVKKARGFKSWWKVLKYIVIGAVIGAVACIVFYIVSPWAEDTFTPKEQIDIPGDDVIQDDTDGETEEDTVESEPETVIQEQELDIDSVRQYSAALREVASDVNHSMVTVTGQGDMMGWLDGTYVDPGSASGLIVAETTTSILILVPTSVVDGATNLNVTFGDSSKCSGTLIKCDHNTGLAIISVNIADMSATATSYYKVATLGNSYGSYKGSDIIVLGSPFGFSGGEVFGTLTGKNGSSDIRDGNFQMLVTDIAGASNESGAVFNTYGEVMGFITPNALTSNSTMLGAIPISDIKRDIERLSNGESIPYMGIRGQDIDAKTAEEQSLDQGIFVTDVELDSPAMVGGLQTGDIIQSVNNKETLTLAVFRSTLLEYAEGDIVKVDVLRRGAEKYEPVSLNVTLGVK